jgi:hypothetical protein
MGKAKELLDERKMKIFSAKDGVVAIIGCKT